MPIFIARYRQGEEFLQRYLETLPHGGLFFPTRKPLVPGDPVLMDIRMPSIKDGMLIRGNVVWRQRGKRGTDQRAGLGIAFAESEKEKRDHLLALARSDDAAKVLALQAASAQRRHRRLPVSLRVSWHVPRTATHHTDTTMDIGTGGAFVSTEAPPKQGSPIVLEVAPPGSPAAHAIEGRVVWVCDTPKREGIGVEFRCRDIAGMRRLRELVRRIERAEAEA